MPGDPDNTAPAPPVLRVALLGSTGSIGTQTLGTIEHLNALHSQGQHPTRYEVVGMCANTDTKTLAKQAIAHRDAIVGVCNPHADTGILGRSTVVHHEDAAAMLIEQTRPDLVVAAIVGIAGLASTFRAAQLGIDIALANKESLVAGGSIITAAAIKSGTRILPIDSEHAGLWQCLLSLTDPHYAPPSAAPATIRRVTLTASGGPFKDHTLEQIQHATIEQALNHPTWSMGKKVSVDSATLMNKALELIEAHWLFGLSSDQLDAVIHPQSTVHAFVETVDGSTLAHLGPTDMRCPIQHALTHPQRAPLQTQSLDLTNLGTLDFSPIDPDRFPAIGLAHRVIVEGQNAGAVLNAANEAAVESFLDGRLNFGSITEIAGETLDRIGLHPMDSLDEVMDVHIRSKAVANELITTHATTTP